MKPDVLVLGLGNTVLTDDGVGPRAARRVRELLGERTDVSVEEAAIAGFGLLDLLAGFRRAVIIDAVRMPGLAAGTVVPVTLARPTSHLTSGHQIDLPTALELGGLLGLAMPREIRIVGVVVTDDRTLGEALTPEVEKAVEPAARLALELAGEPLA